MPDFDIQYFWHCTTADYWITEITGSKDAKYIVTWDRYSHKNINAQYDWSCSCLGYKHRGDCKHIGKVKSQKMHCGWMQFVDGGEALNGKCPSCGNKIDSVGWAI